MTILNSIFRGADRHIALADIVGPVSPHYPALFILIDVMPREQFVC